MQIFRKLLLDSTVATEYEIMLCFEAKYTKHSNAI